MSDNQTFQIPQQENQDFRPDIFENVANTVGSTLEADNTYEEMSKLAGMISVNGFSVVRQIRPGRIVETTGADIDGFRDNITHDEMKRAA